MEHVFDNELSYDDMGIHQRYRILLPLLDVEHKHSYVEPFTLGTCRSIRICTSLLAHCTI